MLRWSVSHISNGVLEAINSLIQPAKAKARGFRNSRYLITMVYLIAGKLDFKLPNPLGAPRPWATPPTRNSEEATFTHFGA